MKFPVALPANHGHIVRRTEDVPEHLIYNVFPIDNAIVVMHLNFDLPTLRHTSFFAAYLTSICLALDSGGAFAATQPQLP